MSALPIAAPCIRSDQDWYKCLVVAPFVKILEVEGVIQNLIYRMLLEFVCTYLVFDYENQATCDDDGVCPLSHRGMANSMKFRHLLQMSNLRLPSIALVLIDCKRVMRDKLAKNGGEIRRNSPALAL
jgi:hypothetical protein